MSEPQTVLLVDDERDFVSGLARLVSAVDPSLNVRTATSGRDALAALGETPVALMLTDLSMPEMDGLALAREALALAPTLSVVLLTGHGSIETAVEAVKMGAYDFLTKPLDRETLAHALGKGLERARLMGENRELRAEVEQSAARKTLVGESLAMVRLRESLHAVAATDYTVLITGESGTGKELIARTIHRLSPRSSGRGPFRAVNCPAIPEELLESELFGHVRGAFSGAEKSRTGLFVDAAGGTVLLDEIGDVGQSIQLKLLRVLQEREVRPVGSNVSQPVDARIIASTNQDLEARIRDGSFREDLFYRLNVLTVRAPALRERREDIPLLAEHFLRQSREELGVAPIALAPEVLEHLSARAWPGNVRELQNVMRRLAVFSGTGTGRANGPEHGVIGLPMLYAVERTDGQNSGAQLLADGQPLSGDLPYAQAKERVLEAFTRDYVERVLALTRGNITEAAKRAGLTRVALQRIVKRHGIEADRFRPRGRGEPAAQGGNGG